MAIPHEEQAPYHWAPDLMARVVDAVTLVNRTKPDVLAMFRGCGIGTDVLAEVEAAYNADRSGTKKAWMARTVVERLNSTPGDRYLGYRRAVLRRVVEFEDFAQLWPGDQDRARGVVAAVRELQGKKDAFTRIAEAEERAREERAAPGRARALAAAERRTSMNRVHAELTALWTSNDPQGRGRAVERLMNELCRIESIAVRDAFHVVGERGEGIVEQIDGAIDIDGRVVLVEVKWHTEHLGPPHLTPHVFRVMSRAQATGLVISASDYTPAGVATCREALTMGHIVALSEMREILLLLERYGSLKDFVQAKFRAATLDKNPFELILA